VDIDLPKLLLNVRAGLTPDNPKTTSGKTYAPNIPAFLAWGVRLYTWMAIKPKRFATFQKLANSIGGFLPTWLRLPAFTGWGYSKDFPSPPNRSFRERWKKEQINDQNLRQRDDKKNKNTAYQVSRPKIIPPVEQYIGSANSSILDKLPEGNLLERFGQELTTLEGHFMTCTSPVLSEQILNLLREKGIQNILAWDESHLPRNFISDLISAGIQVHSLPDAINLNKDAGFGSNLPRAGITGASAAIAETGTLVLPGGEGRSPLVSLLPEIHIAIFNIQDLYPDLSSVIHFEELLQAPSTALISGPSRTADIEMTLTIGVHGPRELYVFCVDDRSLYP
jgi:L-lactate dehydrogenase complex protein LldG